MAKREQSITLRCEPQPKGWQVTVLGEVGTVSTRRLDGAIKAARPLLKQHCTDGQEIDELDVSVQVVTSAPVAAAIRRAVDLRERAADQQDEASAATRDAVSILISEQGVSLRDAAMLLGISYERVRQLHDSPTRGLTSRAGGTALPIISTDEL